MTEKLPLIGLSREELTEALVAHGFEKFRAKQIWHWLYVKGATEFSQMSTISKDQHAKLAEHFSINRPPIQRIPG